MSDLNEKSQNSLGHEIGPLQLFYLAFSTIIGVGWIVMLGIWLGIAGPFGSIVGFAIGGIAIVLVGLVYAEVGAMFPHSGGEVVYAFHMYGSRIAFAVGWFLALMYVSVIAFEAISVAWTIEAMLGQYAGPVAYTVLGYDVRTSSLAISLTILFLITLANLTGLKLAISLQSWLTYLLIFATAIFVFIGFTSGNIANLSPAFGAKSANNTLPGWLVVAAMAPLWYAGFDTVPQALGETSHPSVLKRIWLVITLALIAAFIFYGLVILSGALLVPRNIMTSPELTVAQALDSATGSRFLSTLVLTTGLFGLLTSWNALHFAASRLLYSLGQARFIPQAFGRIRAESRVPAFAIIFVGCIATIGALLGRGAIEPIVNAAGVVLCSIFAIICAGFLAMRRRHPNVRRPFRLPHGNFLGRLAFVAAISIAVFGLIQMFADSAGPLPAPAFVILAWASLGIVFWLSMTRQRNKISEQERMKVFSEATHEKNEADLVANTQAETAGEKFSSS